MKVTAYDYEAQCWTTGRKAAEVRIDQLSTDAEALSDELCRERMGVDAETAKAAIGRCIAEANDLTAALKAGSIDEG